VVFGLVAISLGVQPTRSARSHGFAVSLILIFLTTSCSAGQGLAEHALVPAVIGLWLLNVALGVLGLALFRRAGRERTVLPLD
jgi:lipopolysaccharide export LptBFGC system permease protein LptF